MNKVTVQFHGNLAQFGEKFELYANTANEAIRSLAMQIDGLRQYLRKGFYRVQVGNKTVTQKEYVGVVELNGDCEIHVSPRVAGSGKFGSFIAGAVLFAVGAIIQSPTLMWAGGGIMLGGVAQMLIKPPRFNQDHQGVEDSKSSAFTSLYNVVGQGKQVPRAYGNIRVGSVIISESTSSHRVGDGHDIQTVQTPTYTNQRIELIPTLDPNGKPYNLDLNADSVKEAAMTVITEWS